MRPLGPLNLNGRRENLPSDLLSPDPLGHQVVGLGGVGRLGNEAIDLGFFDAHTALSDSDSPDLARPDETPEMRPPDSKAFAGLFYG